MKIIKVNKMKNIKFWCHKLSEELWPVVYFALKIKLHILPWIAYCMILCYIFHLKWRIVPQSNHCSRKNYYSTNKLPPTAVGDWKAVPKLSFFKKTLRKLNEIYKEMDQQINHKDIYYVPIGKVQNIYNVIGPQVCNIGRYVVLLVWILYSLTKSNNNNIWFPWLEK